MRGVRAITAIDITSRHWQLILHVESQPLHVFMTPDGVMQPTRTIQGGRNSAANFQACVEPCFSALRSNILAWLEDFALFYTSEGRILSILSQCFALCEEVQTSLFAPEVDIFFQTYQVVR